MFNFQRAINFLSLTHIRLTSYKTFVNYLSEELYYKIFINFCQTAGGNMSFFLRITASKKYITTNITSCKGGSLIFIFNITI